MPARKPILCSACFLPQRRRARSSKFALQCRAGSFARPDVRERLDAIGFVPVGNTPEEFTKFVHEEFIKWKSLIDEIGIKPES